MNTCYIALGSNLDNPLLQVNNAIQSIRKLGSLKSQSSWYKSSAIGPGSQPDYINGVICIETQMSAFDLLSNLQQIENMHGRKRDVRWGARTLDLDILLFNDAIITNNDLIIPHPRMFERNFVMFPLFEISPELQFPDKKQIHSLIMSMDTQGLEKLR